ncbi:MAG: biotin--[acetyl-CoA-carboxylase] ligase [Rhodospirillales bacterium]|jgi:BirA family biotin operon repressor/biotin-[acetyl-CoA-carboxylase] ligase|nr:biotin--[acetyl-CoA-carboxylase] ligase [Rhodospirillales bacterium]MBT4005970.1 biotin--[acetyl-CoA-carboxylase] ligase [Rhodospirillales bacterium]MBT5112713.1 biotin--[acetyl-CoA-carboxylase] ligase [Rhodospirillales bacterium]MBT5673483.1 biotin--[acetyl-CoA-carboxylase] ligase [Rhodospirillales bacterium]MBT6186142.1 biotin--[acetyl-CoA-carboxylase] ligase [Rhodospirillales bacterium]
MKNLSHLPNFFKPIHHPELASTNDEAKAMANAGAEAGILVVADRQTAGRGRRGRQWDSPVGNLYISIILKPTGGVKAAAAIGCAASLAVSDALGAYLGPDKVAHVKWPNDVLVSKAKISGLLIEATDDPATLVLGVGINLICHPDDTPYPATSLLAETGQTVSPESFLGGFADAFLARYKSWQDCGFAPLRVDWLARATGIGEPITVRLENQQFDGLCKDLDKEGALILDLGGGVVKKFTAGDVFFPPNV